MYLQGRKNLPNGAKIKFLHYTAAFTTDNLCFVSHKNSKPLGFNVFQVFLHQMIKIQAVLCFYNSDI